MGTQGHSPQLSAHVRCAQRAGWTKMPLGMEVVLGRGDIVSDRDSAPTKSGHSPLFSSHVYCGQTARWTKMPLGNDVGLGSGDNATLCSMGPSSLQKGAQPPIFGQCVLWSNFWMDQDATWYRSRPRPRRHCVRWGPSSP